MTAIEAAKPRRAEAERSISAPATGPATAAAAVSDATRYEPVVALPMTAIVETSRAGPADSVAERARVEVAR